MRIHHLALRTRELDRLERFYTGVLKLPVVRRDAGRGSVWLDAGGTIGMGYHQGNLDRILDILLRDAVIDAIVLEVGTGLRAARWAAHEEELATMLDKLAEFGRRSAKPFAIVLHAAHVETIVARAKQLARERGLVAFDSFERAAAALRVGADYWQGRANRSELLAR